MWQFDGQWFMSSSQLRAEAGSVPCSGSAAEPAEADLLADLPLQGRAWGSRIVGVGGLLPTSIVAVAVPVAAAAVADPQADLV